MPYCRNCGTQLREDVQYCYNCGTAITPPTASTPAVASELQQSQQNTHEKSTSKPMHTNTLFLFILLTLIITAIALVIVVASLALTNFGINGQYFFEQPGINRVYWNIQKIVNDFTTYLHLT